MSGDDAQEWSSIQNMLANGFKQMLHMQLIYLICTNTDGKLYTKTCELLTCFLWQKSFLLTGKIDTQSIPWTSPTPKKTEMQHVQKNTLRQERKVALSLLKNWKWDWWLGRWYQWNTPRSLTKFAPENWWLEDKPFLLGWSIFRGRAVKLQEGISFPFGV